MILVDIFSDFKKWFLFNRHLPKSGYIHGFVASAGVPFGSGKTFNAVSRLKDIYDRYNDYVLPDGSYIKILIYSNIDLNFNSYRITSIQEYCDKVENIAQIEFNNKLHVYNFLFIDEIGAEFNNRNFTKNFTPEFLAKLVTQRHYNSSIFWTAQNFDMIDITFRRLTTRVYTCSKFWRFFRVKGWLPTDLEKVDYDYMQKPISNHVIYGSDEKYSLFNTKARFEALKKDYEAGACLSAAEILDNLKLPDKVINKKKMKRKYRK